MLVSGVSVEHKPSQGDGLGKESKEAWKLSVLQTHLQCQPEAAGMLCSADAEDAASLTCLTTLQMTLLSLLLWGITTSCNCGLRWSAAAVCMACFIVASVECLVAVPVVPCRWLVIIRGVSTAHASLMW